MKVLIAGSRSITDYEFVASILDDVDWDIDTLIHGGARGVDSCADTWATLRHKRNVSVVEHPIPEWVWDQYGKSAGPERNTYMLEQADAVICIWDGESSGTQDVIEKADARGMLRRTVTVSIDDTGTVQAVQDDTTVQSDQTSLDEYDIDL